MTVTAENLKQAMEAATQAQKTLDETIASVKALETQKQNEIAAGEKTKSFKPSTSRASSDEARALAYFGCNHPAQLIHVNTGHKNFAHVPSEIKQTVMNLKNAVDNSRMIEQMFNGAPQDKIGKTENQDRIANVKSILDSKYAQSELLGRLKAFNTGTVGAGADWVPTLISSNFIEEFQLPRYVADKFRNINMPSATYDQPVQVGTQKAKRATQGGTATASNFGTDKIRFNAVKLVQYTELPDEVDQDSAPDIFAAAKQDCMDAQSRAEEYAILRGSTAATHYDSDLAAQGADVAEKLWDGLVRRAIQNSANGSLVDFGNTTVTEAFLRKLRASMGKFGVNPANLVLFVGSSVYSQLVELPSVKTVDKLGPLATVLSGTLAMYNGISIVVSEAMREDVNENGVYDNVTKNRAGICLVNTTRHMNGIRRGIKMKLQESLPASDIWLMASYQRRDFQSHAQNAKEVSTAYGYNIAL